MEDDLGILGKPTAAATPATGGRPPAAPSGGGAAGWFKRGYEQYLDPSSWGQPDIPTQVDPEAKGIGPSLERGYEKYVVPTAQTVVNLATSGTYPIGPEPGPQKGWGGVVPPTLPQAARDVAMFYTPEKVPGWARAVGMIGGSAGLGYETGLDPSIEALRGAGQWGLTATLNKAATAGAGGLRTYGEPVVAREAQENVGTLIKKKLPFLSSDLKTSEHFVDTFGQGKEGLSEGFNQSLDNLNTTVKKLSQDPRIQAQMFRMEVPVPDLPPKQLKALEKRWPQPGGRKLVPGGTMWVVKDFEEGNQTLHDLSQKGFDGRTGAPRAGIDTENYRHLSWDNRDRMIAQMNRNSGADKLGDVFSTARKAHDASHILTNVFSAPNANLWNPKTGLLDQQAFVRAMRSKEGLHLGRSFTPQEYKGLIRAARHGYPEEAFDIPSEPGEVGGVRLHGPVPHFPFVMPSAHPSLGTPFNPVPGPQLPWYMKLQTPLQSAARALGAAPFHYQGSSEDTGDSTSPPGPTSSAGGFGLSSLLGEGTAYAEEPPEHKPVAIPAIRQAQEREISPTPGGAARAGEIAKGLIPGRAPVDVSRDLERGRLSSDEVKKLLLRSGSTDPSARVAGIPLTELMSAAETGNPHEKAYLLPLIQQRMMQELPKLGNKTTQANLARRFQILQRNVGSGISQ